jgi:phosphoglycerate dehydrogenase-like enzyme
VLTIRRRANIACAEHVLCLMLAQAKMTKRLTGRISADALTAIGFPYRPFDRRHTPYSNWPRIRGVRMLNAATLGIIGLGEIGREIALRANAFGMRVLYFSARNCRKPKSGRCRSATPRSTLCCRRATGWCRSSPAALASPT